MTASISTLQNPSPSIYLKSAKKNFEAQESQSILDWVWSLKNTAIQLKNSCSMNGWDGYDALPISSGSLIYALCLISLLPFNIIEPDIVPEPQGDIGLEWRSGAHKIMTLCVSDGKLIYAAILGKNHKIHGEEPFSPNDLPKQIKDILFTHFGR